MKLQNLIKPISLLTAGTIGTAAHGATVIEDDYVATPDGTSITLAGASSPQYTFIVESSIGVKTTLKGNGGSTLAPPGSSIYGGDAVTRFDFGPLGGSFTDGDYGLRFSAGGKNYQGVASVVGEGTTIDRISYDLASVVPEPATWAMMILGFGMVGGAVRSRRRNQALVTA